MTQKTQLESMHEQIVKIHENSTDSVNADVLHRYIDEQALQVITLRNERDQGLKDERSQYDAVIASKLRQIEDLTVRSTVLMQDSEKYQKKANEMQLVAGRYQFQFEHAMKALNAIDDMFEYQFRAMDGDALQKAVRTILAVFTKSVAPVKGK